MTSFPDMLAAGYGFTDPAILLGAALERGTVHPEPKVRVPVWMSGGAEPTGDVIIVALDSSSNGQ